ncbi:uncharacterized protein LOC114349397 isoform X1 [Diabrotica virgifera virgifera]|uniref:Uncharacterized protein LOC114349397 isoform X1 n=1 Tax=Diabrotica virgifera virgifera TaxID=50390 RepID=A0A6P7H203_DIAVI|nr:uncharacterized protein LOC114349397 isoform X1 [Diabrotica virgifera virgifera]
MPRAKKSVVWDYFVKLLDDPLNHRVQCQICNRKMKFFGNTTNLKEHLRRSHPQNLADTESLQSSQNDSFILYVDHPKAKRFKKIKEDTDENEISEEISNEHENIEIIQPEASITIKENLYGETSVTISRKDQFHEHVSHLGTDDFAKVVEGGSFIDKSLLIEDILKYNCVVITAPHGSGKSTNMHMLKRFLEIVVGEDGLLRDLRTTYNYRIFRDAKLQITENTKICKDHMGQHPVIFINFKPLSIINDFDDMITKFRYILRQTFSQHTYLTKNAGLLMQSSRELFQKYCDPAASLQLSLAEIEMGFTFLTELLFVYFRKQVTVLIDNYDAYIDSLMFKSNPDTEKIMHFMQLINTELLKSNRFVDFAFLTGVFPVTSSGIFTVSLNIKTFYFLDNHNFCKYYGVTIDELSELLRKFIIDANERDKTERIIAEYYGGYVVPSQNLVLFNLWSVLNYLDNKKLPFNYWCQPEHYDYFKLFFSIKDIGEEIQQLLLGLTRCTDISKPISNVNFSTLIKMFNDKESCGSAPSLFLKVLYHLGYLTSNEHLTFDLTEVYLRIPNSEIRLEFARILKDTYIEKYNFKEKYIRPLHSAANSFNIQAFENSKFEAFCRAVNDLFINSSYYEFPQNSNNFQCILFTILASKFCITQSEIYRNNLSNSIDILTVNDSGVGIFIETRIKDSDKKDQDLAIKAHRQILDKKCCEYFDKNFEATMGKICIGMCINEKNCISIAYSYHFQNADNIETVTFISVSA